MAETTKSFNIFWQACSPTHREWSVQILCFYDVALWKYSKRALRPSTSTNPFLKWNPLDLVCSSEVEINQEKHHGSTIPSANRLFKRARSSRMPEQWATYRSARNKATNAIKMAKANHFNRMASSLADPKCPPSQWWNIARHMLMCGLKGHSSKSSSTKRERPQYGFWRYW